MYAGVAWASLYPEKISLKTEWVRLPAIVQERNPWALVDPTRIIERSAEIKCENKLNKSVSFNIFITVTIILLVHPKRYFDSRQYCKWDQNPWFVPETMNICQPLHIRFNLTFGLKPQVGGIKIVTV